MEPNLVARLESCERRQRRLVLAICVLAALAIALLAEWATTPVHASAPTDRLQARELVIVDSKGVERVRISGDLPDAVINGKRIPRGEHAAGVMIYDGTGQERGGYVTWDPSGNAGLTLDTRKGQAVLLVAGPTDGAALAIWHGSDTLDMRADPDGARLTGIRQGKLVFQNPEVTSLTDETCRDYRDIRTRTSAERATRACQGRFNDTACKACLEGNERKQ
jgi:hypothetical protein